MSDSFLQSWDSHPLLTGIPQGSGHDALADTLGGEHDDFANHFGRHSHAMDAHPTQYVPPLQPRTESDYSTLPPQPDHVDNPWEWMKSDFHKIWNSHEHGVVGKLLETVAIPGETVAHSLAQATHTQEAKPHDTVGTWYNILSRTGPAPSGEQDASYYARLAGAWGATLLADPLNFIGIGPTEHAVEAANALKSATPAALDVAEGLARAKAIPEVVHAPRLNTESIQQVAAPKLMSQRLQGVIDNLKGMDPVVHPADDVAARMEALGKLQQHVTPGGASTDYLQFLENFRGGKDLTSSPWGVTSSMVDPIAKLGRTPDPLRALRESDKLLTKTPLGYEGNLEALARHQALKEAQIQHGLPAVRLFGAKTPIPSPFALMGQGVSRLAGQYHQQTGLTDTVGQVSNAMGGPRGQAFLEGVKTILPAEYQVAHGGAENVPLHKVYDHLKGLQQGRAVEGSLQSNLQPIQGVLTAPGPLQKWFENAVLQKADITSRRPVANALHGLYDGLTHVAEKSPSLVMQNRGKDLRAAQQHLGRLLEDPTFDALLKKGDVPETFRAQTLDAFHTNANMLFGGGDKMGVVPGWTEALRAYQTAADLKDPNKLMEATQALRGMLEDAVGPRGALKDHVDAMFTAAHDLIHSHTPLDVQQSILKDALDAQKEGRQATSVLQAFHGATEDLIQNHQHANGLHFIGRLPKETLDSALSQYGMTDPSGLAVKEFLKKAAQEQGITVDQMMANVKTVFGKQLQQMVGDGRLTQFEAEKAGQFVGGLTSEGLYHATNYLKGFAERRKAVTSPLEELRRMGIEGFADWHSSLSEMDRHAFNKVRMPFEGAWNAMQWTHTPTMLGKAWNHVMEPIMHATMRAMGWPQRLMEAMNAREGAHAMSKKESEAEALGRWHGQDLPQVTKTLLGRDGTPQELHAIDSALVSVKDYEGGILQGVDRTKQIVMLKQALKGTVKTPEDKAALDALVDAALPKKLPDGTWREGDPTALLDAAAKSELRGSAERTNTARRLLRIDQIARARVAHGRAVLAPIFGENTDEALNTIVKHMNDKHTTPMVAAEVKSGQSTVHMGGYIPRKLDGSWAEKRQYYEDLKAIRDQEHLDQIPKESMDPRVTGSASYKESRAYPSAAHHEYDIEEVNRYRHNLTARQNGPKPPLKVTVDPSLTSRLAMRYHEHFRTQADIALMHELSSVLPSHVLFFLPPRAAGQIGRGTKRFAGLDQAATAHGFQDLGNLVPSLAGFHVKPDLYKFLKQSLDPWEDPSGSEAVANALFKPLNALQKYLKRANVSGFTSQHIRNTAANALVGGGLPIFKRAAEIMFEAARDYSKHGQFKWFSPAMPLLRAIAEHPLYKVGVQHSLFRYGHEYELPLQEIIKMRMNPSGVKSALWSWIAHGTGPMGPVTFQGVDACLRMALMEKFIQTGMTEARAAEMANHRMVDYGLKAFTPSARKVLQTSMPFPSWTIGNLLIHGEQAIRNPFWYAMLGHAADAYNTHEGGIPNPKDLSALAGAISMGHTAPGTNNKVWLNPSPPWKSPLRLEKQITDELATGHPWVAGKVALNYGASRLFPLPFDVQEELRLHGGLAGEEKGSVLDTLFGKPDQSDTGLFGRTMWSTQEYKIPGFLRVWLDPAEWHHPQDLRAAYKRLRLPLPGADARGLLESQFGQVVETTPEGKVRF